MKGQTIIILASVLVTIYSYQYPPSPECEINNNPVLEGNIGETGQFKWLGVLRVHIREKNLYKIALTGIVLVQEKYAVAIAADIVNIPQHIFRENSKAYFLVQNGQSWTCKPKSYVAHPEYEYSTYVTIALIELDIAVESDSPLEPICWPSYSLNTSNYLYAFGYTDEHMLLEKVIYKIQYVNRSLCDEFYNRAQPETSQFSVPVHYQCGYAMNNKDNCVWENGMVLATNSTGRWTLIGFGIRGPGCAGPTRFIDMARYLPWIESSTDQDQVPAYY